MFAGWLETEESERYSWAVPPAGTVADESAKVFCACNRLNGRIRVVRSIELLSRAVNFIRYGFSV